jgi:VanZ family protein
MKKKSLHFQLLSPKTSIILFSILVVSMPFIMLQNYLQSTFRNTAGFVFTAWGIEIPIILAIVIPIILILIAINIKKITPLRVYTSIFIILMLYIGQISSDFYINYKFYDLQNNWHYFAYCFFTVIMYRYLITKNLPLHKIIIITFLRGLVISLFDEGIQVFISNRIFDLSDVAKDTWGLWIGNIVIFFLAENGKLLKEMPKILHKNLKDYIKSPISLIAFQGIFTYLYVFISANMTDSRLGFLLIFITLSLCTLIFIIIHFSQYRKVKWVIISLIAFCLIGLSTSYLLNKDKGLISINNCIVNYKGIPIPYFDVLIKPNGFFRLVDKNQNICKGDLLKLYEYDADIMIFALSEDYSGENKLIKVNALSNAYFLYNPFSKKGVQVLVMNYSDAIETYNRLINNRKNVAMIIHNI